MSLKRAYPTADNVLLSPAENSEPITSERFKYDQGRYVCYGSLEGGMAELRARRPAIKNLQLSSSPSFFSFPIAPRNSHFMLQTDLHPEFAVLDTETIRKLSTLNGTALCRFEALVESHVFSKRRKEGAFSRESSVFHVSINIFGPRETSTEVGAKLSRVKGYLQHPKALPPNVEYHNAQLFRFPTTSPEKRNMNDYVGLGYTLSQDRKTKLSHEIEDVLDSISKVDIDGDFEAPSGLATKLTRYQEDGVRFIWQRENKAICDRLQIELHLATNTAKANTSSFSYGGLIADSMGLGKTLTMLTAILGSLSTAEVYANFYSGTASALEKPKSRTQATLVVVPSAQLLESWISELHRHFQFDNDTLSYVIFHGANRPRDTSFLSSTHIVLTTYSTVFADQIRDGILHSLEWFRVVLDEAHWIRNPSSKQSRAVSSLSASRRWCLTGTPIQNRMEELASLAGFLQLAPFAGKAPFQRHILTPLYEGGPDALKPFRTWTQAYCLRRTEKHLKLPACSQQIIYLNFSTEETMMYKAIGDQTRREIDDEISHSVTRKRYNLLFTALLRMRMLCNRGTLIGSASALSVPGESETRCERCSSISEDDSILFESLSFCPDCGRPLQSPSPCSNGALSPNEDVGTIPDSPVQILPTMPHSTKLFSVLGNISGYGFESKHIVFSYWTSTLDLMRRLLGDANISYVHMDGRSSYQERSKLLKTFKEDPRVTVLLMSIETGAVGLNLTVANVVHIVEPQWNPSVEAQAVARAVRMGQRREVTIYRYVMKDTVEENIMKLQEKKKKLALFAFGAEDGNNMNEKLEDLKFVLNIDPNAL